MFKINPIFKKTKYITINTSKDNNINKENIPNIPEGMWVKCDRCGKTLYKKDLDENLKVCKFCNKHYRMNAWERIDLIVDTGTFREFGENITSKNPLDFSGYEDKLKGIKEKTKLKEGVITGKGKIYGKNVVIAVMDSRFMMGSMGSAVGEKITRAVEKATEERLPIIIFTTSGGARMQESMFSLMQMAKTSAAIARHNEAGLLYIPVLTDPTTGGVIASFAMLGDIILSEPGTLIGFAGRRVIEQTIKQKLPDDFQSAEFLLEHGFLDKIVNRNELKKVLYKILELH
ncbi:acetyl-CoA carboxylase, carboxyltransferase subunit beta [Clostridium novyi]|uniref:Acetyl-coenzyme A carboxylase carboxyl transferase subunit beta n=2 Tax=Clostridium novyi TaxID=1542 RepID=ACCD_CLONN|nr:acetyl-CoA carboxylase, carboxyltransferase subunit beta [Clostridium novyi]A0PXC5.1 RecName: Full=Acetyl-coenzyme A carboxylase carboxyl transferase subunit beta; Short=ACCase subunit beta; Short=Acetyl-CoA carboxylase carboxyltransferase subunit beta [Clostridium novyi NT]ABK61395.1 acetyl-CoA carboxylase, carboxyl transferase, beta subunit [Clostridium novyi NT]KEH86343.1 acetyl-CoA carboxylase subunit beta [Clostridium novyi A str. BKT29909]KEH86872.1 acetyl-CoA carboxylase subunit beta 